MKKSLSKLGFHEEDIRILKPIEAVKIIEQSVDKQTWKNDLRIKKQTENI